MVTATGVKNALAAPELQEPLLSTTAILANMGVEDEYGEAIPYGHLPDCLFQL